MNNALYIGWTTCNNRDVAERFANALVERKLAACVQIDSTRSVYMEDGELVSEERLRLTVKFLGTALLPINAYIMANHPDSNAEWISVKVENVNEKYLKWVQGLQL